MAQIVLLPAIAAAFCFFAIFVARIWKSDPHEYQLNKHRFRKPFDTFRGHAKIASNTPVADGRVHAGLVFNRSTKKLELQGALSREAINRIVSN